MSKTYDSYLAEHKKNVKHAVAWILNRISLNEIFPHADLPRLVLNTECHDLSKFTEAEYKAYDDYFYADDRTPQMEESFDYAWLHHIHANPHHWQYWVLKEDDSIVNGNSMTVKCLDIPDNYIIEMVADWWSFSWINYMATGDKQELYRIFDWYNAHLNSIAMHPNARQKVEALLARIRDELDSKEQVI